MRTTTHTLNPKPMGAWVAIRRVISPRLWVITILILLITPLATTHEPPSRP